MRSQFCHCRLVALILVIGAWAPPPAQAAPPKLGSVSTGTLTYPVVDNVDFREGTLEGWFKLGFDSGEYLPAKEYQGLLSLVSMGGEAGGLNLHYSAQAGAKEPALWCSIGPKSRLTPFGANVGILKFDEWHHVALTWHGCDMALYFDGKKVGEMKQNDFPYRAFGDVGSKTLMLGDQWNVRGMMVLDDLRISRVARTPEELGARGELKPDPYTCLLDPFEASFVPDGKQPTRPLVLFNGDGGLASPQCRFVEGRFGRGLALYAMS